MFNSKTTFLGHGTSIDKLGFDVLNDLATLPPISVFGLLLMAISFGGLALQLTMFVKDGNFLLKILL